MQHPNRYRLVFTAIIIWSVAGAAAAMSADQLRSSLEGPAENRVVVIDVRGKAGFDGGHIPGSLHIPVVGIEVRHVPPLGPVVVVWDGIDREVAARALQALNAKPGIQAELLDGGYPAWAGSGGQTGGEQGLLSAIVPSLTYAELMKIADEPDLVIVDLRGDAADAATDLAALLPNARIVAPLGFERREMKRSPETREGLDTQGVRKRSAPRWLRAQTLDESGLYVLVDSGDGAMAERVARRMSVRGLKRVYMLTGGERILQSGGEFEVVTQSQAGATQDE